jgi:hypothetical protein
MLSSLWDVYYERISMFNVAAAAGAEVWLMVDYIYDGYGKLDYYAVHAVLTAALVQTHSRVLCALWLARARL